MIGSSVSGVPLEYLKVFGGYAGKYNIFLKKFKKFFLNKYSKNEEKGKIIFLSEKYKYFRDNHFIP